MPDPRPRHHITPPSGWLNDPNGVLRWGSRYHMFHQFNPDAPTWGPARWGHVSSMNLVHWTRHPIALAPAPGPDADGCWSGCIVDDEGTPSAVYTGVERLGNGWTQTVCLSRGDTDLRSWRRDPASPVIQDPPDGSAALGFRDPFVWRDGDGWAMVIGSGTRERGGSALLYRSRDLVGWRYVGPILEAADLDPVLGRMGLIWECPQLVPLGDRHLLVYSLWDDERPDPRGYSMPELHHAMAVIGLFDGRLFKPERIERFDHGPDHYAPALLTEPGGRVLAWGWSWEALTDPARLAQGWAGAMTLPRVLGIDEGRLTVELAPEVASLQAETMAIVPRYLTPDEPQLHFPMRHDGIDIEVRFRRPRARRFGLAIRRSPDDIERTDIVYDTLAECLLIARDRASLSTSAPGGAFAAPLVLGPDLTLELRVVADASIVEIVANRRVVLTARIYPTRSDALGIAAFVDGGSVLVDGARISRLADPQRVMRGASGPASS